MKDERISLHSDLLFNSMRILILLFELNKKKSVKLTFEKIITYDFYLKFPKTMLSDYLSEMQLTNNFTEYYSYYHWTANRDRYHNFLGCLIGKNLVNRKLDGTAFLYEITDSGKELVDGLNSDYAKELLKIAEVIRTKNAELSEQKIQDRIKVKLESSL